MPEKIRQGEYHSLAEDIRIVRNSVFVVEQKIPLELEFDNKDKLCHHVVLYEDTLPVGTGRLDPNGKAGRVSIIKQYRGLGYGKKIMTCLEEFARKSGMDKISLHAQKSVISFYSKLGYTGEGPLFLEADIPHQKMFKPLRS